MIKNAYPEKPEVPYVRTSVEMPAVIEFLKGIETLTEVKRAAYCFFRIESGNGKSGVNNNYAGIQADGNRWPKAYDNLIYATSVTPENKTGKMRRFVAFKSWQDSVSFTVANALRRGMYVGGSTFLVSPMSVDTPSILFTAYKREWVTGNKNYIVNASELVSFLSIYGKAASIF